MPGYLQILSSGFSWHLPVVDLTSSRRIPAQPYTAKKKENLNEMDHHNRDPCEFVVVVISS
jgi:nanoRNase/pAp phosphatase (c-di-AMP/oligoRNAs hydrolase)